MPEPVMNEVKRGKGRPRIAPEGARKCGYSLPHRLADEVEQKAKELRISSSAFVKQAIELLLKQQEQKGL